MRSYITKHDKQFCMQLTRIGSRIDLNCYIAHMKFNCCIEYWYFSKCDIFIKIVRRILWIIVIDSFICHATFSLSLKAQYCYNTCMLSNVYIYIYISIS